VNASVPLLSANAIELWRGENLILNNVNVTVPAATIVQIQGSNGSGKTTLLRALIGLADIDEGQIEWMGQPIEKVREHMHESLIYLGHKAGISSELTPLENLIALCPELMARLDSREKIRAEVEEILDALGIADRMDLPSAALSAGQQRRISLARLKLQHASLWVLDEPLTSLDRNGQDWVKQQLQYQVSKAGSVVFTTHQTIDFNNTPVTTVDLDSSQ